MNEREMLDALETARQLLAERDAEIAALRDENARLKVDAEAARMAYDEWGGDPEFDTSIETIVLALLELVDVWVAIAAQHTPAPSRLDPTHTPGGLTPLSARDTK